MILPDQLGTVKDSIVHTITVLKQPEMSLNQKLQSLRYWSVTVGVVVYFKFTMFICWFWIMDVADIRKEL